MSWASLVATTISLVALGLSAAAFVRARRSEKRQLFIRLHELLTSPEIQHGRRLLHREILGADDPERLDRAHGDRFADVNRAIGLYNTLGVYLTKGYLSRDIVVEQWGDQIVGAWPQIESFLRYRRRQHPGLWRPLVRLGATCGAPVSDDLADDR